MIGGETQKGRTGVNPGGRTVGPAQAAACCPESFRASVRKFAVRMYLREEANARAH